jgi:hypothetical protein
MYVRCSVQSLLTKLRACNFICCSCATQDCPTRHNNLQIAPVVTYSNNIIEIISQKKGEKFHSRKYIVYWYTENCKNNAYSWEYTNIYKYTGNWLIFFRISWHCFLSQGEVNIDLFIVLTGRSKIGRWRCVPPLVFRKCSLREYCFNWRSQHDGLLTTKIGGFPAFNFRTGVRSSIFHRLGG